MHFRLGHDHRGKPQSPEHAEKSRRARLGQTNSPEHRMRIAEGLRGNPGAPGESNGIWKGDDVGYHALHHWMNRNFPKTGICEECGANIGHEGQAGTHYHTTLYTRNREDWQELCPGCHGETRRVG